MMKILLIHGPNLNLLGLRQPKIYGTETQNELVDRVQRECPAGSNVELFQSNHEGEVVDRLNILMQNLSTGNAKVDGILINPAAWTHTSVALRDALAMLVEAGLPAIEIHLTNIASREDFRRTSVISGVVTGTISGLGGAGYTAAARAITNIIQARSGAGTI
jgi:3-dehydroquinate dehydratase-2